MDSKQIHDLMDSCNLPGRCDQVSLKETHISWVILTNQYAFKIKRPVKYSFLDFSSLEKRKYYCHEELRLNKRLAPRMYLKVLPLSAGMLANTNYEKENEIIDYAVQMKRMDNKKEMDIMLKSDKVTDKHISKLARTTAHFHKQVDIIKKTFDTENFQKMYTDINSVIPYLKEMAGKEWADIINECIERSDLFLKENEEQLKNRTKKGFQKDCHGDLNSRNIFLYDNPVIFDCIEFNEEFRQIDVLNEIAFLCVDLDFFDKKDLGELFYQKYCKYYGVEDKSDTRRLFMYYKSYRANIRAKVTLISAEKIKAGRESEKIRDALKYIKLMQSYS